MMLKDYTAQGLRECLGELAVARKLMDREREQAQLAAVNAEAREQALDKIISATDSVMEAMRAEAHAKEEAAKAAGK